MQRRRLDCEEVTNEKHIFFIHLTVFANWGVLVSGDNISRAIFISAEIQNVRNNRKRRIMCRITLRSYESIINSLKLEVSCHFYSLLFLSGCKIISLFV